MNDIYCCEDCMELEGVEPDPPQACGHPARDYYRSYDDEGCASCNRERIESATSPAGDPWANAERPPQGVGAPQRGPNLAHRTAGTDLLSAKAEHSRERPAVHSLATQEKAEVERDV